MKFERSVRTKAKENAISVELNEKIKHSVEIGRRSDVHLPQIGFSYSIHSFEKRSRGVISTPIVLMSIGISKKIAGITRKCFTRFSTKKFFEIITQCSISNLKSRWLFFCLIKSNRSLLHRHSNLGFYSYN